VMTDVRGANKWLRTAADARHGTLRCLLDRLVEKG
jgi:hypothetical protein